MSKVDDSDTANKPNVEEPSVFINLADVSLNPQDDDDDSELLKRDENLAPTHREDLFRSRLALISSQSFSEKRRLWILVLLICVFCVVVALALVSSRSPALKSRVSQGDSAYLSEVSNMSRVDSLDNLFSGQYRPRERDFEWVEGFGSGAYISYDYNSPIMIGFVDSSREPIVLVDNQHLYRPGSGDRLFVGGVSFSFDRRYLLIQEPLVQGARWRHSRLSYYYILDLSTFKVQFLSLKGLLDAQWNPAGLDILYSLQQDLYLYHMESDSHVRITNDAESSHMLIFNGIADWVYEEEVFEDSRAAWWSPDGSTIVFVKFNDTKLMQYDFPLFHVEPSMKQRMHMKNVYPEIVKLTYPRPGTSNPVAELYSVNVAALLQESNGSGPSNESSIIKLRIPGFRSENDPEYLIYEVKWSPKGTSLLVRVTNRVQDRQLLLLYNNYPGADFGQPFIARNESMKNGWYEKGLGITFLDETSYLNVVPEGNFNHIACYDITAPFPKLFWTAGTFEVTELYGFAEIDGVREIFFQSTRVGSEYQGDRTQRHIWSVSDKSINRPKRWSSNEVGFNEANLSPDGRWLVISEGGPTVPRQILKFTDGKESSVIESNEELSKKMDSMSLPRSEIINMPIGNTAFNATLRIQYPLGFSENRRQFYPMLVEVYGGPKSQKVSAKWSVDIGTFFASNFHEGTPSPELDRIIRRNSTLAQSAHGYESASYQPPFVYVIMDVRGTGFAGNDYSSSVSGHLGEFEPDDVISVTRDFVQQRSYIDSEKVALWGWSYGGYLTSKVVERQSNEPVFSAAVAVAPVIDWKFYDTVYTERYMKKLEDNQAQYEKSKVDPTAPGFQNTKYLVMHGLADDNVHYQNTAVLENQLQKLKYPNMFRTHTLPDNDHGMSRTFGSRDFIYKMLRDWVVDAFKDIDRTRWAIWSYDQVQNNSNGINMDDLEDPASINQERYERCMDKLSC